MESIFIDWMGAKSHKWLHSQIKNRSRGRMVITKFNDEYGKMWKWPEHMDTESTGTKRERYVIMTLLSCCIMKFFFLIIL
jgi:hypothetical protein